MNRRILPTLALSSAALGLAACGSSGTTSTTNTAATRPGIVMVKSVDGADVLASSAGKTLYSTTAEKGDHIRCVASCTSFWSPVLGSQAQAMSAASKLGAQVSTVKRPDGQQQLTFKGLPLYTFAEEGSGSLSGDGFSDNFQGTHFTWQAARTDGSAPASHSSSTSEKYEYGS